MQDLVFRLIAADLFCNLVTIFCCALALPSSSLHLCFAARRVESTHLQPHPRRTASVRVRPPAPRRRLRRSVCAFHAVPPAVARFMVVSCAKERTPCTTGHQDRRRSRMTPRDNVVQPERFSANSRPSSAAGENLSDDSFDVLTVVSQNFCFW